MTLLASRIALAAAASVALLFAFIPSVVFAQSPGLVADHFSVSMPQTQALIRADEAIRAASLKADSPTAISRGGRNDYLTVLIHCMSNGDSTLVDLEVASNGHSDECLAMRASLSNFMKTGKAPTATGEGFTGEWDTACYGGYKFKMRLVQRNGRVTGTYDQAGGTIDGTVSGNVLRFRWSQTNGSKGTGRYTLAEDRKSFSGFFGYEDDPDKADRYWNGTRNGPAPASANETAEGPSFSGEWDTKTAAGSVYRMKLTQVGSKVTGTYGDNGLGTIEGTVSGRVLRFKWKQSNGNKGAGRFSILPNGKQFAGAWTYEDDPEKSDKPWDGDRVGPPPASQSNNPSTEAAGAAANTIDQPGRANVGGGKELVALDPTLSPPGHEDKRPIYALPKIVMNPAPLPLPPLGIHRTIPDNPAPEVKGPDPLKIVRLRLSHMPGLARGTLNVEAELSRKPLPGECVVEFYVGGYLSIDYKGQRFYDAYEFARPRETEFLQLRYSQGFTMPDVLPAIVRAEVVSPASGRVIDHAEEQITHPFLDVSLDHVMLYGDEAKTSIDSGMAIVGGSVPDGLNVFFSLRIPNKAQADKGLEGMTYKVAVAAVVQGVQTASVGGISRYYGDKPPSTLNLIKWTEKDADPSAPGPATERAEFSIEIRNATQNGWVMDERKIFGFGGPNRGYDATQLKRLSR